MTLTTSLTPTCQPMEGAVNTTLGTGAVWSITFGTSVVTLGDTFTLTIVDNTGVPTQLGTTLITAAGETFCFTYNYKMYLLAGLSTYFSVVDDPTNYHDVSETATDGFVTMANQYQAPEDLTSMASYQGKVVFFSRHTTQIWQVTSDPAGWSLVQILTNIGTMAPASVQSVGDLDVFFLSDTGIRSLRVRDSSNNAYVDDLGAPIDQLVQAALIASPAAAPSACSVWEPTSGRYWCFLNGTIYVYSAFPSAEVKAWNTYTPVVDTGFSFTLTAGTSGTTTVVAPASGGGTVTIANAVAFTASLTATATAIAAAINATTSSSLYSAVASGTTVIVTAPAQVLNTYATAAVSTTGTMVASALSVVFHTVTPKKFVAFGGQAFFRATDATTSADNIYVFGGTDNNTYDSVPATVQTPWLDLNKPGTRKSGLFLDIVSTGAWLVSYGMDYISGILDTIYTGTGPSLDLGIVGTSSQGTRCSVKAVTTGNTAAVFSEVCIHTADGEEE